MRQLSVTAFRSYRSARLSVSSHSVVLTGMNGAGKTNLLEALSFLAPGRGLRRAQMAQVQNRQEIAVQWAISASVETPEGPRRVGTGRDPDSETERRVIRIDGAPTRGHNALSDLGAISWQTPDMDGLFTGGASARRQFLDRLVFGFFPSHAAQLSGYERAMRDRNRLLKDGGRDPVWLDALEVAMAEQGIAIAAARIEFVARLASSCAEAVSVFPAPSLAIDGMTEELAAGSPSLLAEQALRARLAESRGQDAEAGRALVGPHRSDLAVRYAARDMPAALCSTGEQKALLIALILGAARLQRIERGAAPLLLLDEIAAHLDAERRAALFHEIDALGAQAWMTGTDASLFEALAGRATFVVVEDGDLAISHQPNTST
ncbi:MAG: DNA replication/repair protein RecF [Rhodospirillaceae bacterium]|nr:DNA replication/repair protein RecF [Rhodospirillaceae bacterium]MCY4238468.1 DNA replication/repair protein RecF [Rhodospirillaceae bacterium]